MRFSKKIKFNMIIAILLCMVFVVNLGTTLAATNYSFGASSISVTTKDQTTTTQYDTYTEFGSAQGTTGQYVYSVGTVNNQLSINYGFSQNYDLMIKFTAEYTGSGALMGENEEHIANDFSLNFSNRDEWLIDMGMHKGWTVDNNGATVADDNQIYYNSTSNGTKLSGVMYYMGTKTGSGTLPVISGVTFHTSPNNSYRYVGDMLTITLTPVYVKSSTYYATTDELAGTTEHSFKNVSLSGFTPNATVFESWISFMDNTYKTADDSTIMIYNAYVDHARSLAYPVDQSVVENGQIKENYKTQPIYSNTAHRYTMGDSDRTYNAITAGNHYHGGVGIYVIPNSTIKTISVSVGYNWQKNNVFAGTTTSNVVELQYSTDEITAIEKGTTTYYYYNALITKPTYINVLDYIRFTAENYESITKYGYSLILNNISVNEITNVNDTNQVVVGNNGEKWADKTNDKKSYTITNSTVQSPVLARVTDVSASEFTNYDANITITNNGAEPLNISGFTVSSKLWYGDYDTQEENGEKILTSFDEMAMGDGYLKNTSDGVYDALIFDTNIWYVSNYNDGVFTFAKRTGENVSLSTYIPSGYAMTLISGIKIVKTPECENSTTKQANDFWCSLDITITTSSMTSGSYGTTAGVEVITDGYYNAIESGSEGKIYIRNNTNQVITGVSLEKDGVSTLEVYDLQNRDGYLPRNDRNNEISADVTKHLTGTISIKPNEMVLAYTITASTRAIIYDFDLTVTLENSAETSDIDLQYNQATQKGVIINNSDSYYEFRLVAGSDITSKLNENVRTKFVMSNVGNTYYFYYKGIICPHRHMEILNAFVSDVRVEYVEHSEMANANTYVASGVYADWNTSDATGLTSWFTEMKKLYNAPTTADRQNAIKVTVS